MLSDEMTTGSVTSTDAEKRNYAARSHSWNLQQKRFREAFPEVSFLLCFFTLLCSLFVRSGTVSQCGNEVISTRSKLMLSMRMPRGHGTWYHRNHNKEHATAYGHRVTRPHFSTSFAFLHTLFILCPLSRTQANPLT